MIKLREDQEKLIGGARRFISQGYRRILAQAPCGAGKTVMASFVARGVHDRGKVCLYLVHRTRLLRQSVKTFERFGIKCGVIAAGVPFESGLQVYVGMIDTVRSRIRRGKLGLSPDLVQVDECHHAAAKSWASVLHHFAEQGAVVIGWSATPRRPDGKSLKDIFDVLVHGPQPAELIDQGHLAPYEYYAPPTLLDTSDVPMLGGDYKIDDLAKRTNQPDITGDAVEHYKELLGGKRAVLFAVNIQHSKDVAAAFCAAGIPAAHIDGEMPDKDREEIEAAFDDGRVLVLCNVMLATEGFDCPECDGVIMLRKTASEPLYIQMAMRPMRPHPNKPVGIILDHVGNFRLGMPDQERIWTLEDQPKRKRKPEDEGEDVSSPVQCPDCYRVHLPAPVCPYCGHVYKAKPRAALKTDVKTKLEKVTPEQKKAAQRQRAYEESMAETLEQLIELGKARGYQYPVAWAKKRHAARGKRKR